MKDLIWILLFTLPLFLACGSEQNTNESEEVKEQTLYFEDEQDSTGDFSKIAELKVHFGEEMNFEDDEKAEEYLVAVDEFATAHPDDARTPQVLYESGFVARNLNNLDLALAQYEKVWTKYPNSRIAPEALFLNGFIYDEDLSDKAKAAERYRIFLEKYPDNKFYPDVEKLLQMIELTPEEILEKLQSEGQ